MTTVLEAADPSAVAVVAAVRAGEVATLRLLLLADPDLAAVRIRAGVEQRTLLHVLTDWPGHVPRGPEVVSALVEAGAEVDAPFVGPHEETALHWAASSDDVAVLDALLDAGAAIDAGGGVVGGGTPLADATAFGQWAAAHRLVERGARVGAFDAAALGLLGPVRDLLQDRAGVGGDEVDDLFWAACHGGRRQVAELLLAAGADLDRRPGWEAVALDAAVRSGATELAGWLRGLGATTSEAS